MAIERQVEAPEQRQSQKVPREQEHDLPRQSPIVLWCFLANVAPPDRVLLVPRLRNVCRFILSQAMSQAMGVVSRDKIVAFSATGTYAYEAGATAADTRVRRA